METQEKLLKETVSLPDLIVWAQSAGIHPTLIVSLVESSSQATEVEASQYLQEAQEYLAHAQECFSQGDRSKADHWELMVYEAIQKVSLKRRDG